jgi:hypothetical protein
MALPVCAEAGIRLLLETLKFLGLDPSAPFYVDLRTMLGAIKWLFIFLIIKVLVKHKLISNSLIVGIPAMLNMVATGIAAIPFIGIIGSAITWLVVGSISSAITSLAFGIILLTDERINLALRLIALPGMMMLGAMSGALIGLGVVGDVFIVIIMSYVPYAVIALSIAISGLIFFLSPGFLCELVNKALKLF